MVLDLVTSRCLVSQEMREAIQEGIIKTPNIDLEGRVQSSSFEPMIGDEVWVIDTETGGLFRPADNEPIYRTLLQLPGRRRQKYSLINGFELKEGFSYLFKLEEKFALPKQIRIKASPKSSQGRIFDSSKFMADYNGSFNKVAAVSDDPLESWLFVQPLKFNLIAWPGLTFNQLRFSVGNSHKLTDQEIEEEYQKNCMLYKKKDDPPKEKEDPLEMILNPSIQDGLGLTLDLKGIAGIVGLKARKNYTPIDLKAKGRYNVEDYFEPIEPENGSVEIKPNDCGLFFSKEFIRIPAHLNAELKDHSDTGINGPLHFAGFFDNNFNGCCVFEIRSGEVSSVTLKDGMPISELQFFRCNIPDKLYGTDSHYQGQDGPRVAKFFKDVDFMELARQYQKLNKHVLTLPTRELNPVQDKLGFEFITPEKASLLERSVKDPNSIFHLRRNCETDKEVLQVIPYVLIFNQDKVFYYQRSSEKKEYGDSERLGGKYSVGAGGHIHKEDAPDYLLNSVMREVFKEEVNFERQYSAPLLIGTIKARDEPVDRVHFGGVYVINTNGNVTHKEKSIRKSGLISIDDIISDYHNSPPEKYETWSKILIPRLPEIKEYLDKRLEAKTI